jgi:hypothetical protein
MGVRWWGCAKNVILKGIVASGEWRDGNPHPPGFFRTCPVDASQGVGTESRLFASQHCQKRARPTCSQALMLPILAQNNTSDDFTTAAVEMRGFFLRSETSVTMSLES